MVFAEAFTDLLRDPNHWGFEIIAAVVEFVIVGLILTPLIKRWIRTHDKVHHNHECEDDK